MEEQLFQTRFYGKNVTCYYIKSEEAALAALEVLLALPPETLFGLDTETAGKPEYLHLERAALSPPLSRIRLLQIHAVRTVYVFDLFSIEDSTIFLPFLETRRFIAHFAMFDLGMLKHCLGVRDINIGCTLILYKIITHAVYPVDGSSASLESLVKSLLGVELPKSAQRSDWSVPDLSFEQIHYSAIDAVAVSIIADKLSPNLKKYGLQRTYQLSKAVQHPLVEMQLNGMKIDIGKHDDVIKSWSGQMWDVRQEVTAHTGIDRITDAKIAGWLEENLNELEKAAWPRTKGSKVPKLDKDGKKIPPRFSTGADAFADFNYLPVVKPIAKFKKMDKLLSSFGSTLLAMVNPATGRVHTGFNIGGARTGRLSSSKPNLQQYPRDEELRSHFIPEEGHLLVCADYSQIEVRVAAEISQDEKMLEVYATGQDIYSATAAHITDQPIESIGKKSRERQIAKALVLGLLFGLGASKFSHYAKKGYGVDVSLDEAIDSIAAFRELYSTFRSWQMAQAKQCKDSLYVRTLGGKLRRLASDSFFGPGLNHPVQGTAAEVIFHALVKLHRDFMDTPVKLINCVHDEIIVECPAHLAETVRDLMNNRMVEAWQVLFPNGITRGLVNVDIGTSWGDAKPG